MNYQRTRYVGGPKLDTPGTADRADALKARLAQLRGNITETPAERPYEVVLADDERYDY